MIVCVGIASAVLFSTQPSAASSIREFISARASLIDYQLAQSDEDETEEHQVAPINKTVDIQQGQEITIFRELSIKYYVANYCATNGAFFTSEEVGRLKSELQSTFASLHLSQQQKDAVWNNIQATAPARLTGVTDEDCASEKQAYALIWPQVFAPTDAAENPF